MKQVGKQMAGIWFEILIIFLMTGVNFPYFCRKPFGLSVKIITMVMSLQWYFYWVVSNACIAG